MSQSEPNSRNRDANVERGCMDAGERGWEGEEWDALGDWIDIYTLLCIKQKTNENLLCRTGNSTQCSVVIQMKGNLKKGYMYTYS